MLKTAKLATAIVFTLVGATTALAQTQLLKNSRDWASYRHQGKPAKICFAMGKPKTTLPRGVKRGQPLFYVSSWPNEGVKAEVSVALGYPTKTGSVVQVKIGRSVFKMIS